MINCETCIDPEVCQVSGTCLHRYVEQKTEPEVDVNEPDDQLADEEEPINEEPYGMAFMPSII
jgi:hypothetical protein